MPIYNNTLEDINFSNMWRGSNEEKKLMRNRKCSGHSEHCQPFFKFDSNLSKNCQEDCCVYARNLARLFSYRFVFVNMFYKEQALKVCFILKTDCDIAKYD